MSTAIVKAEPVAAPQFTNEKIELIKQTVAKGATDDELAMFLHVCQRTGLDPFMRQIHAIKRWNSAEKKMTMAIQTAIDGYRLIADRTGNYMPDDSEPIYSYDGEGGLEKCTVFVQKYHEKSKVWKRVPGTAHYSEYVQRKRPEANQELGEPTQFWKDKPHIMLSKCAEALALRKAFPAELSGIYTHEEMMQADLAGAPGPVEKEAHGHVYKTEAFGKVITDHVFEQGSHTYCRACTKMFEGLPEKERNDFGEKFTKWMKSTDVEGEVIPTTEQQIVDAPSMNDEDWDALAALEEKPSTQLFSEPEPERKLTDEDYAKDLPPTCPDHAGRMKFVKGGVSQKSGKPYHAFWSCQAKGCKRSKNASNHHKDLVSGVPF